MATVGPRLGEEQPQEGLPAAAPGPPPPPAPPPAPAVLGHTCVACKESKVRCDRQSPCGRCLKRNLTCVPQERRRFNREPGPRKVHSKSQGPPRDVTGGATVAPPLPLPHTTATLLPSMSPPPSTGTPFLDIIFRKVRHLREENKLDRRKAMITLQTWADVVSRQGNRDITWSGLDAISRVADVQLTELLPDSARVGMGRELLSSHFPSTRISPAAILAGGGGEPPMRMDKTDLFQILEDGVSALAMINTFNGAAVTCSVNLTFDRLFLPAEELGRTAQNKDRLMLARLGSSLILAEDQEDYFEAVGELLFSPARVVTRILQVHTRSGETVMSLLRLRLLPVAELASVCVVFILEPVPTHHRYRIVAAPIPPPVPRHDPLGSLLPLCEEPYLLNHHQQQQRLAMLRKQPSPLTIPPPRPLSALPGAMPTARPHPHPHHPHQQQQQQQLMGMPPGATMRSPYGPVGVDMQQQSSESPIMMGPGRRSPRSRSSSTASLEEGHLAVLNSMVDIGGAGGIDPQHVVMAFKPPPSHPHGIYHHQHQPQGPPVHPYHHHQAELPHPQHGTPTFHLLQGPHPPTHPVPPPPGESVPDPRLGSTILPLHEGVKEHHPYHQQAHHHNHQQQQQQNYIGFQRLQQMMKARDQHRENHLQLQQQAEQQRQQQLHHIQGEQQQQQQYHHQRHQPPVVPFPLQQPPQPPQQQQQPIPEAVPQQPGPPQPHPRPAEQQQQPQASSIWSDEPPALPANAAAVAAAVGFQVDDWRRLAGASPTPSDLACLLEIDDLRSAANNNNNNNNNNPPNTTTSTSNPINNHGNINSSTSQQPQQPPESQQQETERLPIE